MAGAISEKQRADARWAIDLGEFNLEMQYVKGTENQAADFLSRCRTTEIREVEDSNFLGNTEKMVEPRQLRGDKGKCRESDDVQEARIGIISGASPETNEVLDNKNTEEEKTGEAARDRWTPSFSQEKGWRSLKEKWKEKEITLETLTEGER